jgi:hypothetical protein
MNTVMGIHVGISVEAKDKNFKGKMKRVHKLF